MTPTIQTLLRESDSLPGDSSRLDVELLLCHVLGKDRVYLRTWPEQQLNGEQFERFQGLLARRRAGEPIAYLVGHRAFWNLDLQLNRDTLIPRPETETLVQCALDALPATPCRVLDLGTGSGAIALALASERSAWRIDAVDVSAACVAMARHNAAVHGLETATIWLSDWYSEISGAYHLIVSNPPYVDPADPHLGQGDVRFEPRRALVAADAGMAAIKQIVAGAMTRLEPGGVLMFEHGWDQAAASAGVLADAGFIDVTCHRDLAGRDRVSVGCKPGRWSTSGDPTTTPPRG